MLEQDETTELIRSAQSGDECAKARLITENAPLIKSVIRRFKGRGIEYDDLYQLGCVGFLKAIKNFSFDFNVRFSTYAVPMILGEVKRYLRDDGYIKVSRTVKTEAAKINAFIASYRGENGKTPSVEEIAEKFGIEPQDVVFTLDSARLPVSIYDGTEDDGSRPIIDRLPSEENENDSIDRIMLKDLISSLPERDRKIILLRYFRGSTQCEVAKLLGVSQVQISRLENKILAMMREEFGEREKSG
ncbi:MAG TPA: sigma-70 family RNA polymerase sigma factor [Firmicutes bacterium]|nr:sigma-70 family RNA polymerase sigma factor [Bacillota bacterium]